MVPPSGLVGPKEPGQTEDMNYQVALINPPIVHRTGDPFGDIPYMPTGILYLAGYLSSSKVDVNVIDGFGLAPRRTYKIDTELSATGLTEDEIVGLLSSEKIVGISVHSGMSHSFSLRLAAKIRARMPGIVLVAGGSQASALYREMIAGGFDYVCVGEGEHTLLALIRFLRDDVGRLTDIPGLAYRDGANLPNTLEDDLDQFGFGLLSALPLDNYWKLAMSHAPVNGKYMVITTSRGCPYNCSFCTTPRLLGRKWRSRSPKHVVDEIESAVDNYGIEDVIIQDEIFSFRKEHAQAIAAQIIERNLRIRLHLPSGVKVETLDDRTLVMLRDAGLTYMCLAPESGSERVLEKMNKPMNRERLYHVVSLARRLGIGLGCFFVLGFPGEDDEDRRKTRELLVRLTKMGVNEVSLFIWSPLPGADAFESETGWARYEDLNWSPSWRANFRFLARYRRSLYAHWVVTKIIYQPLSSLRSAWNILRGHYELKGEMAVRRLVRSYALRIAGLFQKTT